jgi:apolipoprotein N-acyltransferase
MAFAPLYFFFFAIIAFSGLILISNLCNTKKESFWIGWCFGFGQFLFGLYWICISLFVDAEKFLWLLPFALFLIPAILAIYTGLTLLCVNIVSAKFSVKNWQKILLMALFWVFFEYLRATLFTGFPWNLLGYSLLFSLSISQAASIFGIYGLSIFAVIFYCSFALLVSYKNSTLKLNFDKKNLPFLLVVFLIILLMFFIGNYRLGATYLKPIPNAIFRLVQPNIKQGEKWGEFYRYNSFLENAKLSVANGFDQVNYVVWSESAVPYVIDYKSKFDLLAIISKAAPKDGFVITGGLRATFKDKKMQDIKQIWNSVFVINRQGKIISTYDKNHLVPFGEYVPLEKYLPFVSKITQGAVSFSSGGSTKTIKTHSELPSFSPLVCYEVIFTNKALDRKNPPQFLLNLTNDAWFGNSSGPYQHFDMARMRAIEYATPVIRVANSGISALIDPLGRIVAAIPLNKRGILDVMLMEKLPATPYLKYKNSFLFVLILIILLIAGSGIKKNKNE